MAFPTTIEELQRDVLTLDLSGNPNILASPIASKDNKLKTVKQKITQAINEVFGMVVKNKESTDYFMIDANVKIKANTENIALHQEAIQLNTENIALHQEAIQGHTETIASLSEQMNAKEETLETINTSIAAQDETIQSLNEQIKSLPTGGGGMTRTLHSKVALPKNGSISCPFTFTEIIDLKQQIVVASCSKTGFYTPNLDPFVMKSSSTSSYDMYTYPIDIRVNVTSDKITIVDKEGLSGHMIYFYTLS